MAGQKVTYSTETPIKLGGRPIVGLPVVTIVENGKVEEDDEWALFRLTDDGLAFYKECPDFRASIMGITIGGRRAVQELSPRYKTEDAARTALSKMTEEEQRRTLVRSVRPR